MSLMTRFGTRGRSGNAAKQCPPSGASPPSEELQRFINSKIGRWSKVVHKAGIAGTE